jgi:hypothetical protein
MAAGEVPIAGYQSKLLSRVEVAEGTMAFHFEKPAQFDFKPGQSAVLTLSNPPETDAEGNTRTFSIASPPFENHLMFTTRMRDTAFKRSLKKVPLGRRPLIGSCRQKKYRTGHYINPMHNWYIAYAASTITSGRPQPSQVTKCSLNFFHGKVASRNSWSTDKSILFYTWIMDSSRLTFNRKDSGTEFSRQSVSVSGPREFAIPTSIFLRAKVRASAVPILPETDNGVLHKILQSLSGC